MTAAQTLDAAFTAKVRAGLFVPCLRRVRGWHDGDDRTQEGLCQVWLAMRRHHETTGELLADGALITLCRRRSRSRRDNFVPRERRGRWSLDVYAVADRGVRDLALDADVDCPAQEPSADALLSAKELLERLPAPDRDLALALVAGATTREMACAHGTSPATVVRAAASLRKTMRRMLRDG